MGWNHWLLCSGRRRQEILWVMVRQGREGGTMEDREEFFFQKRGLAALKKQRKKQYRIRLTRKRLNKGITELKRRNIWNIANNMGRKEPKGNIQLRGTMGRGLQWRALEGINVSGRKRGISTFLTNPVIVALLYGEEGEVRFINQCTPHCFSYQGGGIAERILDVGTRHHNIRYFKPKRNMYSTYVTGLALPWKGDVPMSRIPHIPKERYIQVHG